MRQLQLCNAITAAAIAGSLIFGGLGTAQDLQFSEIKDKMTFDSSPVKSVNGVIASYAPALESATPAVVTIFAKSDPVVRGGQGISDPRIDMLRRLLGDQLDDLLEQLPEGHGGQSGLGSGVILSADGYILTNNHVVSGADRLTVALKDDKREYPATLIGGDKDTDVALIKIEAKNLKPMRIGDSSNVKVGDVVLAVGNPLGLEQTVTQGIVSALGRRSLGITGREGYENFIQTDASINVGNSGGALIDAQGRLIGMNTAIKTDGVSRGNMGIAFAIPSNMALNVVRKLVDGGGKVRRGFLGIGLDDVNGERAQELGLNTLNGSLVRSVNEGTPAHIAGLKIDDFIVEIDGRPISDSAQLRLDVSSKDPGTEVNFKIIREGAERAISVVLGDKDELLAKMNSQRQDLPQPNQRRPGMRPAQPRDPIARRAPGAPEQGAQGFLDGVGLQNLDRNLRSALDVDDSIRGVFVSSVAVGSEAAQAGLEAGQIITQVDQENVNSIAEASGIVENFDGQVILLQVYKDGRRSILAVPVQ